ncbi:unnamed protein product [Brassicogethes aeneus]|uniref:G patch domain-containing protein 11 n=1 Tax=Brassicogethes aeneus TaxID=1431903 RepID=A0A9P0BF06_BRAAE|nr:unnamed protein product [Brassicogethes aeneus]
MSDSEDDYMSFKVLVDCQEDVRPSLLFNREKRKHELFKKKQDPVPQKRQKSFHELERENRDRGLNTAISTENKGFKLLEKMGFKPGDGLGKSKAGLKEPIDIVLRQGTSGVGRESHIKEVQSKRVQHKINRLRTCQNQFRLATKERTALNLLRKDFYKAQRICEELDFRIKLPDPVEEFYWTKETIKKRRKLDKKEADSGTESSDDEFDEEFEQYITEDNLSALIDYIRSKHLYCLYCVITGTDEEDLRENCPGPYRRDHDDELE